jgi:hypothetical protein
MTYLYKTNQFGDPRLTFIVAGRLNVTHPVMKLDHRIPWNVLKGALNKVLDKKLDSDIANVLMKLSPSRDSKLLKAFATAVKESAVDRQPPAHQVQTLQLVEQEIFSLPINLALGLNERADDPGGDNLDFTTDDVDYAGAPLATQAGRLQKLRERLFGQLSVAKIDIEAVDKTVDELISEAGGRPALASGTAGNYANWHPGPAAPGALAPVARTQPAYRYWVKPTGTALTSAEILTMIDQVTARAKKAGK